MIDDVLFMCRSRARTGKARANIRNVSLPNFSQCTWLSHLIMSAVFRDINSWLHVELFQVRYPVRSRIMWPTACSQFENMILLFPVQYHVIVIPSWFYRQAEQSIYLYSGISQASCTRSYLFDAFSMTQHNDDMRPEDSSTLWNNISRHEFYS